MKTIAYRFLFIQNNGVIIIVEYVKIIVDGRAGVGKTTMLKSLIEKNFDPYTKITIGVDFFKKNYNFNENNVIAQFWDLAGVSRFDVLRSSYYRGANAIVLVGDLTRATTFDELDYFVKLANVVNICSDQIILVGNKNDLLKERSIHPSHLALFIRKYGITEFFETSARFRENIEVIFELATLIALHNLGNVKKVELHSYKEALKEKVQNPIYEFSQKLIRNCWHCGQNLYFSEFSLSNPTLNKERLIKLWENKYLEFFCCKCFKKFDTNYNSLRISEF
ncbi:MAG: Rab family GTPase [Promethearchaeota archaeon]